MIMILMAAAGGYLTPLPPSSFTGCPLINGGSLTKGEYLFGLIALPTPLRTSNYHRLNYDIVFVVLYYHEPCFSIK